MTSRIYDIILEAYRRQHTLLFVLLDPDGAETASMEKFVRDADAAGVDGFLVGGSLSAYGNLDEILHSVKGQTSRPVIIFPGGIHHLSSAADAILFLSLISGRNADQLIGQQVIAAPIIRRMGLEAISTGYMLVESGSPTTAEYMSNSRPIPRGKPEIAAAHAMAAEMLGMKMIYLEAGSGADLPVPDAMIAAARRSTGIPILVGGGIRSPRDAWEKARAGATGIVIGNHFEETNNRVQLPAFVGAVHDTTVMQSVTV